MDLLDILVYPAALSPSVPNTPPPTYEPPPPSYPSSDAWSVASMSTLSLERLTDALNGLNALNDVDSMSILTSSDVYFDDDYDSGFGGSSYGIAAPNSQPELQNQLVLNLIVYELLTHQSGLSRSPSRGSLVTASSDFFD
ncbi:hypothetical protein GGI07_001461 [Coemansia sp. Benny D115]|nr:hypothetical protein GGI07_001461 [Coemansia sp. Benny D115]